MGKTVDPKFKKKKEIGLPTFGLPKEARKWVILCGMAGGGFTLFYLIGQFFYDPDVVAPISQMAPIYITLINLALIRLMPKLSMEKKPGVIELTSIITVAIGGILVTYKEIEVSPFAVVLLVILVPLSVACYAILKKKGIMTKAKEPQSVKEVDPISFRLQMFIVISLVLTITSVGTLSYSGSLISKIDYLANAFVYAIPWIILSMIGVFFSFVFELRAFEVGKASIVVSFMTVSVVGSTLIVTPLISSLFPGALGAIELDLYASLLKIIGAVLIITGIVAYSFTEDTYFYLLISTKIGEVETVFDKLTNFPEIECVSSVAGEYDIVAKVRNRSVGRFKSTISEIEKLYGINQVQELLVKEES